MQNASFFFLSILDNAFLVRSSFHVVADTSKYVNRLFCIFLSIFRDFSGRIVIN